MSKVVKIEVLSDYWLRLKFNDGEEKTINFSPNYLKEIAGKENKLNSFKLLVFKRKIMLLFTNEVFFE